MEHELIPLRTLTVLLSYEFLISDPRFFNVRLIKSSLADPAMITRLRANYPAVFKDTPGTIREPIVVDPQARRLIEFEIQGPKLDSLTTIISGPSLGSASTTTCHNGQRDNEPHLIVAFPSPQYPDDLNQGFVVDMTTMQYGQAGRGPYGENYFLGTFKSWEESMKNVCAQAKIKGMISNQLGSYGNANEQRLRARAKKAWERWQNREKEGWCAFCGKPGDDLQKCSACTTKKVFCCKAHQKSDWKLHKHTCEKKQK